MFYKTYLQLDNAVKAIVRSDAVCQRLMTVPRGGRHHLAYLQGRGG